MKLLLITLVFASLGFSNKPKENKMEWKCDSQSHLGVSQSEVIHFHQKLVSLVSKNDMSSLAELVKYPLRFYSVESISVSNKNDFIKSYEKIFNQKVKSKIKHQAPSSFFCNYQGLMYGSGEVWVNSFDGPKELKIITINHNN